MPSFIFDVLQVVLMFAGITLLFSLSYLCHVLACFYGSALVEE